MRPRTGAPAKTFDAMKFKEEAQRRAAARWAKIPPAGKIKRLRESVESGPWGEWWKSLPASKP